MEHKAREFEELALNPEAGSSSRDCPVNYLIYEKDFESLGIETVQIL